MSTAKTVVKNSVWLLVANVILRLISAVVIVLLARRLGTDGFGQLSFAMAFVGFFALIASFGFNSLLIRDVARNKSLASKYISNILSIKLLFSFFSLIALYIISMFIGKSVSLVLVIYILGIELVVSSFVDTLRSLFHAYQKMEFESIGKIIEKILWAGFILLVIYNHLTLVNIALAILASAILALIITFYFVKRYITNIKFEFDVKFCKLIILAAIPFALTELFSLINFKIDQIMLSFMTNDALVGVYSAAYKIIDLLGVVPSLLLAALYPVFAVYYTSNKKMFNKSFNLSLRYVILLCLPIVVGIFLLANQIIIMLYGNDYILSAQVLKILIGISLISFINTPLFVVLNAIGKQKITMINTAFTALVNIVMNIILIPLFSINGAALATILSEITFLILSAYQLKKVGVKLNIFDKAKKPLIASVVMGIFVWYFIYINIFIIVPLAAIIYFGMLFLLKEFSVDDISMVKNVLEKKIK